MGWTEDNSRSNIKPMYGIDCSCALICTGSRHDANFFPGILPAVSYVAEAVAVKRWKSRSMAIRSHVDHVTATLHTISGSAVDISRRFCAGPLSVPVYPHTTVLGRIIRVPAYIVGTPNLVCVSFGRIPQ